MLETENGFATRVKIINPGLTYDLRAVGVEGLVAAIDGIDAPDPLFMMLTPEQRVFLKELTDETGG